MQAMSQHSIAERMPLPADNYSPTRKTEGTVANCRPPWLNIRKARVHITNRLGMKSFRNRYGYNTANTIMKKKQTLKQDKEVAKEAPLNPAPAKNTFSREMFQRFHRPKTRERYTIAEQRYWYQNGERGKILLTTKQYPYLLRNTSCPHGIKQRLGQYCDVLGPTSCHACTEVLNRKMMDEYHRAAFPSIKVTTVSLVAPVLARKLLAPPPSYLSDIVNPRVNVNNLPRRSPLPPIEGSTHNKMQRDNANVDNSSG
ncbi:uncharacterized protein LOC100376927 [Saccoglossus kowalevskii]|uniref:Uncharacterized protein LOC100376927 n=1 Tax=Saccoglossus kowalevskii TaxID=10224 RepID=A0ABM0GRD3_SACKO|nr:PREDICTED: uncharacterized protein LOC100376927 [Saccoglossus kowalevskii]